MQTGYFDVDKAMNWYRDTPSRYKPVKEKRQRQASQVLPKSSIAVVGYNDTERIEFPSLSEAEKSGYYPKGVKPCLKDSKKMYRGYYWKIKN